MNRALATTSSGDKSASTPLIRGAGGVGFECSTNNSDPSEVSKVPLIRGAGGVGFERNSYIVSIYCILIGFYVPFVLSLFHEKHLLCHMNRPVSKIS